jgi:membrane-bound metal-dependent hydrolase YbcI (DUF457 family)
VNAPTHALLGAVSWLALAGPVEHRPGWQQAAGTLLAVVVSVGPDIDNARWWRKLDRYVPDEWLGYGGPLAHRGLTHWWGWPALVAWTTWQMPAASAWPVLALAVGWASHLLGDLAFGITPPGVPLAPWSAHVGLRLKVGGVIEWLTGLALVACSIALVYDTARPGSIAGWIHVATDQARGHVAEGGVPNG